MSSSEEQKALGSRQKAENSSASATVSQFRKAFFCLLLSAFCLLAVACRRDMQDQPKAIPYRASSFFRDGNAARQMVPGTVARGYLRADREFYFGKKPNVGATGISLQLTPGSGANPVPASSAPTNPTSLYPDDVETFPIPITQKDLERGQERYNIFCSVCHGATGNGDGIIARRGFNKPLPASYHQDRLRQAPVGHFFDAMTNGWGAMPAYAAQIPVEDRWRIIAYIRALQLSQMPAQAQGTPAPGTKPVGGEQKH